MPAQTAENSGTVQGSVSIPTARGSNLTVALASSDTSELSVPATIIVPAGQTSASFTATVVNDDVSDGDQNVTVSAGATGWTGDSAVIKITDVGIPAPVPQAPANGSSIDQLPVTFTGTTVSGASWYLIQYWEDGSSTPLTVGMPSPSLTTSNQLAYGKTYNWRMAARDANDIQGVWSDTWTFSVKQPHLPAPTLLSPANSGTTSGRAVTLSWQSVPGATSYNYEIQRIVGGNITGSTTATSVAVDGMIVAWPNDWRVQAVDAGGAGIWSDPWRFKRENDPNTGSAVTVYASGGPYHLYGSNVPMDETDGGPEYFYNLDKQAEWTFLGEGTDTKTFPVQGNGYVHYAVMTPGVQIQLDAIGMPDWYVDAQHLVTGNAETWWETYGAPDNAYCQLGQVNGGISGSTYTGYFATFNKASLKITGTGAPSGSISDTTPAYVWNAVPVAAKYRLMVRNASLSAVHDAYYTPAEAGCPSGSGDCSVAPAAALPPGDYTWQVIAFAGIMQGDWTDAKAFSIGLGLSLPNSAKEGDGTVQGTVSIPSAQGGDLVVNLSSSDTSELTVPATVTIPAGQTAATFNATVVNDTAFDGDQNVTVTATATGWGASTAIVKVEDNEAPSITVSLPANLNEGGSAQQATVSIPSALGSNLVVSLSNSDTTELTVPASVTIPAGQTSATFNVTPVDDTAIDGSQTVMVTASATGYNSGSDTLDVQDNEAKAITVSLPASAKEGDGTVQGTVSIPGTLGGDLVVSLASNDTTELTVPATVTFPAGQTSVTFNATVVNDAIIDGDQTVTVTGSASGWTSGSDTIILQDDEARTINVSLPASAKEGDGTVQGTVSIPGTLGGDLVVSLASNDTTELTVPATVTIPAGQTSATFTVTVVNDNLIDGTQKATVTATATGWTSGSDTMDVTDNEVKTLALSLPATAAETAGPTPTQIQGTVSIPAVYDLDLVVTLASSDTSELSVPASVTIPAGQTSASFSATVLDDTLIDGDQSATVTASASGWTQATASVTVTDNEKRELKLDAPGAVVEGQGPTGARVYVDGTLAQSLVVALASSNPTEVATAQNQVTIPAGKGEAAFQITAVDDDAIDGAQTGTITASATGWTGATAQVQALDDDHALKNRPLDFLDAVLFDAPGGGAAPMEDLDGDGIPQSIEFAGCSDPYKWDTDGDGLGDGEEDANRNGIQDAGETSPCKADTDGDGLSDKFEKDNGLDPLTADNDATDTDKDGLTDLQELQLGTDRTKADTDGDAMPDGWEVTNKTNPLLADAILDYDQDGLNNLGEYTAGTDPYKADTDGDAMPDGWEVTCGLDPTADDAAADPDGDGVGNLIEYKGGMDPTKVDSDGDGLPDGVEDANRNGVVDAGETDPCRADSDGDGLSDGTEDENHNGVVDAGETDPRKDDTDGDGLPDGWEARYGLDPLTAAPAATDTDSDGFSDLDEYAAGSDPTDAASRPLSITGWLPVILE